MTTAAVVNTWIIEDSDKYRNTISNILNNTNGVICPFAFESCESALGMLDSYKNRVRPWAPPQVILLDINFKENELTGIEAIASLKSRLPDTHIIMLTINNDADSIRRALEEGASGYLLKESKFDEIINAVTQAANGGMLIPPSVASYFLEFFKSKPSAPEDKYGLSKREKEVLSEMAQGLSQKEIAERLFIAADTVNSHISKIYKKLHVHSAHEAVAKAIRENMVD